MGPLIRPFAISGAEGPEGSLRPGTRTSWRSRSLPHSFRSASRPSKVAALASTGGSGDAPSGIGN